jgi:hypothetical protein
MGVCRTTEGVNVVSDGKVSVMFVTIYNEDYVKNISHLEY